MTIAQSIRASRSFYSAANTNLAERIEYQHLTGPDIAERVRLECEAFYMSDITLRGYVPGDDDIAAEITMAIRTGCKTAGDDGEIPLKLQNYNIYRPGYVSPLNYVQKLLNLRALFDSYGEKVSEYSEEFDAALTEITEKLISEGGAYVVADRAGVADSIKSIFYGLPGKYSTNDINAMVVLSEQRLVKEHIADPNEFVLGTLLGYEAAAIMALRNSGRLSDFAVETVWDEFVSYVDNVIDRASERVDAARSDPFRNRNRSYSPVDAQIVYRAISVMLEGVECGNFNNGIRKSLEELDRDYRIYVRMQIKSGALDQRYNTGTFLWHFGGQAGEAAGLNNMEWSIRSGLFERYFGLQGFALRGNIFGKAELYI